MPPILKNLKSVLFSLYRHTCSWATIISHLWTTRACKWPHLSRQQHGLYIWKHGSDPGMLLSKTLQLLPTELGRQCQSLALAHRAPRQLSCLPCTLSKVFGTPGPSTWCCACAWRLCDLGKSPVSWALVFSSGKAGAWSFSSSVPPISFDKTGVLVNLSFSNLLPHTDPEIAEEASHVSIRTYFLRIVQE